MEAATPAPAPSAPSTPAAPAMSPREAAIAALEVTPEPAAPAAAPSEAPAEQPRPQAAPAEPKPPEKPAPLSPQLAQLAKRDKELRAREEALKARETEAQKLEGLRKEVALNPLKALETFGLTFEQVQDFILNGKQPTADVKANTEIASIRAEVEAMKKAREEESQRLQKAAVEQARTDWKAKATELAKTGDAYEYVSAVGQPALDMALEVFEAHYQETGEALPMADVLKHVEGYYEQQVAERLLTTKKLKAKITPVASQPAAPASSEAGPTRAVPRSLPTASATMAAPPTNRPMTRAELRAAAIAALERAPAGE